MTRGNAMVLSPPRLCRAVRGPITAHSQANHSQENQKSSGRTNLRAVGSRVGVLGGFCFLLRLWTAPNRFSLFLRIVSMNTFNNARSPSSLTGLPQRVCFTGR